MSINLSLYVSIYVIIYLILYQSMYHSVSIYEGVLKSYWPTHFSKLIQMTRHWILWGNDWSDWEIFSTPLYNLCLCIPVHVYNFLISMCNRFCVNIYTWIKIYPPWIYKIKYIMYHLYEFIYGTVWIAIQWTFTVKGVIFKFKEDYVEKDGK